MAAQQTQQNTCPINHCEKPAPSTTICHECADDVHKEIYRFLNVELDRLHAIAYGIEKTADRAARQQHGKTSSPPDALKLGAWALHWNITTEWPPLLDGLASRPDAEILYWKITNGCQRARLIINGDPKEYAEGDIQEANKTLAQPMPLDRLIEWLWEQFRLRITRQQVYNWTHRGKVQPISNPGMGYKMYRPKDVLQHL